MRPNPIEPNSEASLNGTRSAVVRTLMESLYWLYDQIDARKQVIDVGQFGVQSMAVQGYDLEKHVNSIIRWTAAQAGLIGFTTNLGGVFTLPIAIPANVAGVSALQIHMVQEIARARGYDPRSDQVKTLVIACLAGGMALDLLKDVGIAAGTRLSQQMISQIAGSTLQRMNQAVGFRLVTKAGSGSAINLAKFVPFAGGLVSGTVDGLATAGIGAVAKRVFVSHEPVAKSMQPGDEPFEAGLPTPAPLLAQPAAAKS